MLDTLVRMARRDYKSEHAAEVAAARRALREALDGSGKSREGVAQAMGVGESTVYNWLSGKAEPDLARIAQLAKVTGQPITLAFGPGQEDADRPAWAARIQERVDQMMTADDVTGYVGEVEGRVLSAIQAGRQDLKDEMARVVAETVAESLDRDNDDGGLGGTRGPRRGPQGPRPGRSA